MAVKVATALFWVVALAAVVAYVADTRHVDLAGTTVERYCRYWVATETQVRWCMDNTNPDLVARKGNAAALYATGMDPRCGRGSGPLCRD